jgi:Zn-dependent protease
MANIASSIAWLFSIMKTDPRVFQMLMGVNLMVAVANLIPIPPLAGGDVLAILGLPRGNRWQPMLERIGPVAILALVAIDRLAGWNLLVSCLSPLVQSLAEMIQIQVAP